AGTGAALAVTSGKVGIGTATPGANLTVAGTVDTQGVISNSTSTPCGGQARGVCVGDDFLVGKNQNSDLVSYVANLSTGTAGRAFFKAANDTFTLSGGVVSTGFTNNPTFYSTSQGWAFLGVTTNRNFGLYSGSWHFAAGSNGPNTEWLTVDSSQNVDFARPPSDGGASNGLSTWSRSLQSVGSTSTAGINIRNITAATSLATVQMSPGLDLSGAAWKSDATAASQAAVWRIENLPATGAATITSSLRFNSSIAGAAFNNRLSLTDTGTLTLPSGSLGIGTTSPGTMLDVVGSGTFSTSGTGISTALILKNTLASSTDRGPALTFQGGITPTQMGFIAEGWDDGATTDSYMQFATRGADTVAEAMRIASTGSVGVGTTTTNTGKMNIGSSGSGAVTTALALQNFGTTANGTGSMVRFLAKNSAAANQDFARISGVVTDNTSTSEDGRLTITTMLNGTLTDTLSAVSGNVGIGTSTPSSLLSVGSSSQFQVNSTGNLIQLNGVSYTWPSLQGAASTVLTNNGSGTLTWTLAAVGTVTGSGTATKIPKWSTATALTDSLISDDGTVTSVGSGFVNQLTVLGPIKAGSKTDDGTDPAGANGMVYYNSTLAKLRCYEGGAWTNCVSTAASAGGWMDNGTTVTLITSSDSVGIGTGSPTAKLHVSGTVIANGGQMDLNTSGSGVTNIGTGSSSGNVTLGNTGNSVRVGVSFVPTATNSYNLGADAANFTQLFIGANGVVFEGATDNGFETTLNVGDPTADRTINFPNASGNVLLDTNTGLFTLAGSSGSSQAIGFGDTLTVAAGSNITTTGSATDVVTVAIVASPTFTSVLSPSYTGVGAVALTSGGVSNLTLDTSSSSGGILIGTTTTGALTIGRATVTTTVNGTLSANTFASSGVTITGGTINGTSIGATTVSTGAFSTLTTTGNFTVGDAATDRLTLAGELLLGNISSDPSGTNGLAYYNSTSNKFRCFENGAWIDCIAGAATGGGWTDDGTIVRLTTGTDQVRINTTAVGNGQPLEVNGVIRSITGGIQFPDGT
ncbi:MAG: hypothetical protein AAB692_03885, partial [Patescibacteria group bacterium]